MALLKKRLEEEAEDLGAFEVPLSLACEEVIMMPSPGEAPERFSLLGRKPFRAVYDCSHRRIALATGRQIGKSTFLGNRILALSSLVPFLHSLYVSPTHMQTGKFSNDRLRSPMHFSPDLQILKGSDAADSILCKKFRNGSEVTLRYAFRSADRIRGIFSHNLYLDEFQDLLTDVIPVIEQCLHNAPPDVKAKYYAGTFKSTVNPLTDLYYNKSTRMEWIVPCKHHPFTYWNVLGLKNVSRHGLVCEQCGERIDSNHPEARWASADPTPDKEKEFMGFRLPQIALPCDWEEIWWNMHRHRTDLFYNDSLALPFDSGFRPLNINHLQNLCKSDMPMVMHEKGTRDWDYYRKTCQSYGAYAGVDWGQGTGTGYTILSIGTYAGGSKFQVFFHKRYEGVESDPEFAKVDILKWCRFFNVQLMGLDFGYGFGTNPWVVREFGSDRAYMYEYVTSSKAITWDTTAGRFKMDRTDVLSNFFHALRKAELFELPRFTDFYDPYGKNFLAEYMEESKSLRRMMFDHSANDPDDCLHSTLYAYMVSMQHHQNPAFFWAAPRSHGSLGTISGV